MEIGLPKKEKLLETESARNCKIFVIPRNGKSGFLRSTKAFQLEKLLKFNQNEQRNIKNYCKIGRNNMEIGLPKKEKVLETQSARNCKIFVFLQLISKFSSNWCEFCFQRFASSDYVFLHVLKSILGIWKCLSICCGLYKLLCFGNGICTELHGTARFLYSIAERTRNCTELQDFCIPLQSVQGITRNCKESARNLQDFVFRLNQGRASKKAV